MCTHEGFTRLESGGASLSLRSRERSLRSRDRSSQHSAIDAASLRLLEQMPTAANGKLAQATKLQSLKTHSGINHWLCGCIDTPCLSISVATALLKSSIADWDQKRTRLLKQRSSWWNQLPHSLSPTRLARPLSRSRPLFPPRCKAWQPSANDACNLSWQLTSASVATFAATSVLAALSMRQRK